MSRQKTAPAKVDETAPTLTTLAPEYSFDSHGVYFTILKNTIESKPLVRNIALAGTYGTGKSSILGQVAREFPERVVEVSLLTMGARPAATTPTEEVNPAATSTTNLIQKEIVKQLLYRQKPSRSRESRFRRIVRFRWWPELVIAAGAGIIAVVLALLAGVDLVVAPTLGLTISNRPQILAVIAMFVAFGLLAGALTFLARAVARGRIGIEKVTAGPATITLPPRSASYFDEYLDEIIYFFETNPKLDIVVIEDLDRFNDPYIFESLRSLNGILNAATQLRPRTVRFIYAVRDSVFEKLGRGEVAVLTDEARAELVRANRTKFFELIVPVVPFITHKNARDRMAGELRGRGHAISKDLVDLAARHLADMRLIHNVLNEYEVFKHRLLDVLQPVPELDPDRLFAMVLFKNAHLADFEKVRHGDSSLDRLWEVARQLVRANLDRLRAEQRDLRNQTRNRTAAIEHAETVSDSLISRLESLANAPGTGLASPAVYLEGAEVSAATMRTVEFWRDLVMKNASLTVQAHPPGYSYGTQSMVLDIATLEVLTGHSLDESKFEASVVKDVEARLSRIETALTKLPRMNWADLATAPQYVYTEGGQAESRSFRGWAEEILPSDLAADLVSNGFITSYFPLHVSSFYGTLVRPRAMTYVMRFVDNGRADPDFALDAEDVEALLWSEGKSILSENSVFNIGIIDHLLGSRPAEAKTVVANITGAGRVGEEFIDRYLEDGARKTEFVALLAVKMPQIFELLATTTVLESAERPGLVDEAIAHQSPDLRYDITDEVRAFLTERYAELPSLASGSEPIRSTGAVRFLWYADVYVSTVRGLPVDAIAAFKDYRAYQLSRENLELITGSSDISLDRLADFEGDMFDYAAEQPAAYVKALQESEGTAHATVSRDRLIQYLKVAADVDSVAAAYVAVHASPECTIPELTQVPTGVWPALARGLRVPMTFANVTAYLDASGIVDEHLAVALTEAEEITNVGANAELTARQRVALAILNTGVDDLDAVHRVQLAASVNPGELPAAQLVPRSGVLVGELIRVGLVADDAEAFEPRLMVDWETQAHAVAMSSNFKEFVSPASLDSQYVAPLLEDASFVDVHYAIVKTFPAYRKLPRVAYEAYASRALSGANYFPRAGGIKSARAGGVSVDVTVQLLARFKEHLSPDELRELLRSLGTPWSKIADPGYGPPVRVPDSPHARIVASELRKAEVVSKFESKGDELYVSRRQK